MKKLLTLFALMLLCIGQTFAYDFEVNGIYYNKSGSNATVTNKGNVKSYSGIVSIPATVTYGGVTYNVTGIGGSAFYGCSGLSYVSIPSSVTSIGYAAFCDCSNLTSVTIPNGVKSIGDAAFSSCTGLTSITIPSSVSSMGDSAFDICCGLTSIVVTSGNTKYDSRDNCNAIIETATNTLILGCKNTTIPSSVTSIGDWAFYVCEGLTSITIPYSVTSIGYAAFSYCDGLTSVTIPSSVTSIGDYAFEGCSGLTSVTIPGSVTSIGSSAFSSCDGLTSVTIPGSVTSIGSYAFSGCSGLTSIAVTSGNTKYDSRDNCNAIIETSTNTLIAGCKNTIIPNSVTSIGDHAFYNCSGLTSVTIPTSVTSIGGYAFYYCSGLTSVTIPGSVTSIGDYVFANCNKLKSITCMAAVPPSVSSDTFSNVSGLTIHVLEGTKSIYETSNGWKNYTIVDDVPAIKLTSMTLDKSEYACEVNEVGTASVASYLPEDASIKQVTWSIDDPSIAFIDAKTGQFVGLKDGVTTITATAVDGSGVTASAVVRVGNVRRYTVKTNDPRMGSVSESGYCVGSEEATIYAFPNEGYEFVEWQSKYDSDTSSYTGTTNCNPLKAPFEGGDITITAIFQEKANTEVSGLANTIYLEPFSAVYGQTVEVSVRMKNSIAATGFQFNMYLPEGVSVVKDADGFCDVSLSTARTTAIKTNTFDASTVSDGSLMVLAASTKNFTFSGNDGEVVRLKLAVSKDLPEGEYPIVFKNIEITDASGTPYRVAYLKTNMSVTSYRLGDVNADGSISVADFSAIASHIMENTPTGFVEQAADVNQDGFVTVSDLSSLVPIIIAESTGGASHSPKMKVRSKVKTDISGKDNIIYASDVTVAPGKDFTVSFNMKNLETAMTGFQYNVTLPEGITVCKDGDGFLEASLSTARTTTAKTNTFDASIVSDGTLMVLAASTKNFTFSGTDGEVVTVKMHADENLAAGTYDLSIDRIELTDDKGTPFRPGEAVVSAITVKAPQALTEVDFDFTDPASLGITPAAEIDDVVDITAPITKGAVTATVDGGVEVTIDADAYILEIDRGGALTLSTTAPSKIVKVEFGNDADTYIDKISATTGTLDGFVWTGSEEEVVFEVADTRNAVADITTIKVWLEGGEAPAEDLTFTDGEAYTATAAKDYGKVTYTRTFDNTNWQALYVPFSMDYEEWSEKYDIAEINNFVEYDDDDNGVYDRTYLVVLKKTSGSTEPNTPYLIRAKETGKHSLVLQNKTLEAAENHSIDCRSVKNEYTFTGTYTTVTDMYANGYYALNGGHLQQPASASVTLSPQRWYMAVTSRTGGSSVKAQTIRILVDGEETTGIETSNLLKGGSPAYDLTGRAVSTATNVRGITISNGKKVIR